MSGSNHVHCNQCGFSIDRTPQIAVQDIGTDGVPDRYWCYECEKNAPEHAERAKP